MRDITLEELLEKGFVVVDEDQHFVWVAKEITDCEGEFCYQMVDKEKNRAIYSYPRTSSKEEVSILNKITNKLYNK